MVYKLEKGSILHLFLRERVPKSTELLKSMIIDRGKSAILTSRELYSRTAARVHLRNSPRDVSLSVRKLRVACLLRRCISPASRKERWVSV